MKPHLSPMLTAASPSLNGAADVQFPHPAETPVIKPREPLTSLRGAERVHILRVLEQLGWNKKQAAKVLEISRGTLYRKILEYELKPNQPEPHPVAGAPSQL